MTTTGRPLGVAVIGAGYWGPNLIRNFEAYEGTDLRWVCDASLDQARRAVGRHSTVKVTAEVETVLHDPSVRAVAIATPVSTHAALTLDSLRAGKHVLVEKPLAASVDEGVTLVEEAARQG